MNDMSEILEDYAHNHDIQFHYKGVEYFLVCCEPGYDYLQEGLNGDRELCRCESGNAMTDLSVSGVPLYDVLKEATIDYIY